MYKMLSKKEPWDFQSADLMECSFVPIICYAFYYGFYGQANDSKRFFHAHHLPTEGRPRQVGGAVHLLSLLSVLLGSVL